MNSPTDQLSLFKKQPALVVLSGGQDSVTCLGMALKNHSDVYAISFTYGQRHSVEIEQVKEICSEFHVNLKIFDIPMLQEIGDSALIDGESDISADHPRNGNLPASFVPNRNALFLTVAHAYAQKLGIQDVYTGVCQTDYSGYPDCRLDFIEGLNIALNSGSDANIRILTPLMFLTKAETFSLAEAYDFLEPVLEMSHTCYNGDRDHRHEWGYGCGECPACELRAKGYWQFKHSGGSNA